MMKVLYLDTETTGLDPKKNDIIQVAGIVEIDGQEVEAFKFNCQPFDYGAVKQSALDVHGFTIEQIRNFPDPRCVYDELKFILVKYIDKYNRDDKFTLAGQNVRFDADFLNEFFIKNSDTYYGSWFNWRHVDLLAFVRILNFASIIKTENDKLETLAKMFDVELKAHDALEDIRATRTILKKLIERYLPIQQGE